MGSTTYIAKCLRRVCALLKVATLRREKFPCRTSDHNKLDFSTLLSEAQHRLYKNLVGMADSEVQIGRFDICYALIYVNICFLAPREGHLTWLVNIFGYLQNVHGKRKSIAVFTEDIGEISGEGANTKDWLDKYPVATEDIDEVLPEYWGYPLSTAVYFDSDHAHDQVTRQLVFGDLSFVGYTPISWTSKRQGTIESFSYSAEFLADTVSSEEVIALRYMLRSLGVPIRSDTALCSDNLGMIISCTNPY